MAEGSPDEVFTQVSNIFENLPNRKTTSLHDYDVTFITGTLIRDCFVVCTVETPFIVIIIIFTLILLLLLLLEYCIKYYYYYNFYDDYCYH